MDEITNPNLPAPQEPAAEQPQPGERSLDVLHALLDGTDPETLFSAQPAVAEEPQEPVSEPEIQALPSVEIPEKFRKPDGSLDHEATLKSYAELQKVLGEQGHKMGQMEQMLQEWHQWYQYNQQQQTTPAENEIPVFPWEAGMTPEEKEKFMEQYYEDPLTALQKRDQQTVKALEHRIQSILDEHLQPLAPIIDKHKSEEAYKQGVEHLSQQITEFTADGRNPDYFDLMPQMQQIINKYGEAITMIPNAVEVIYSMAKDRAAAAPPEPLTVESILKDPEKRKELLAHPELVAEIRKGYVQGVSQGAPPVVIGSQPGGMPTAAPAEKPRSVREASGIFKRFLGQAQS